MNTHGQNNNYRSPFVSNATKLFYYRPLEKVNQFFDGVSAKISAGRRLETDTSHDYTLSFTRSGNFYLNIVTRKNAFSL